MPTLTEKSDLTRCAEDILLAREAHFPATTADLYDSERLEKLFEMYTKMASNRTVA